MTLGPSELQTAVRAAPHVGFSDLNTIYIKYPYNGQLALDFVFFSLPIQIAKGVCVHKQHLLQIVTDAQCHALIEKDQNKWQFVSLRPV